jgi:alpha-N-arabinofuranosidase
MSSLSQELHNPIIPGFHPDPSIIRVNDDYYIVHSSFQYFPGVPIYHSKDLINWEHIGNVLDRESQLPLQKATSWRGIFAPTIRYNEGTFYMITTNIDNGGNFFVKTKDPKGPWSEPIWLKQQGIDPSLYFEDGKAYMVSNPDMMITLNEINPETGEQLTPSKGIWAGCGGRWPEAPHIYKKDGYYYLLISEGGTELAHHLTIARSKDIYGPYEPNPNNPILTNCSRKGQYSQVQGTGHGDFVQAKDGSWWVVFLAYRHYGGGLYHHLGRETFIAPVEWKEGEWPIVNGGNIIEPVMPVQNVPKKLPKVKRDSKIDKGSPEWIFIQNPVENNYKFENGKLTLTGSNSLLSNDKPTFVGRRQEAPSFELETEINIKTLSEGCTAGLSVYQIHDGHFDIGVRKKGGKFEVLFVFNIKSLVGERPVSIEQSVEKVKLRVRSDEKKYFFEYSINDGKNYEKLDEQEVSLLSTEAVGGFTGVVLGMYAEGKGNAEFAYFDYNEKE